MKILWIIILFFSLCSGAYLLGSSYGKQKCLEKEKEVVIKEIEVIKYVERKKADIYSKPNASRSELLQLLHSSKL